MAALHVQINGTNDVFQVVTKEENKNYFNDCGDAKVHGDLGGGEKKVHRGWRNKQRSEHLISREAALVFISKLWVNDLPAEETLWSTLCARWWPLLTTVKHFY